MRLFGNNIHSDLQDPISSAINEAGKNNPFTVPDGYFEKLTDNILNSVKNNPAPSHPSKNIGISTIVKSILIVALLSITAYFVLPQDNSLVIDKSVSKNYPLFGISNTILPPVSFDIAKENQDNRVVFSDIAHEKEIKSAIQKLFISDAAKNQLFEYYKAQKQLIKDNGTISDFTAFLIQPFSIPKSPILSLINQRFAQFRSFVNNSQNPSTSIESLTIITPEGRIVVDLGTQNNNLFPEEICSETVVWLDASRNGNFSYVWSTGETRPDISVMKSGIYSVTASDLRNPENILNGTIKVSIMPKPKRNHDFVVTGCVGEPVELSVSQNNNGFEYFWPDLNQYSSNVEVTQTGLYLAQIKGCEVYTDSFFVNFQHCEITTPSSVNLSSNGETGLLTFKNISFFPNTILTVYNRRGNIVYESKNYQNDWNMNVLPDGSYFYVLQFKDGIRQEGNINVRR